MDRNPVFARDQEKMQIFYADAWALVHYMIFGEGMQGGGLLNRFNQLLQQGVPQKQAFVQVFGDYASFDKAWFTYTNRLAFGAGVLPAPPRLDEKSFAARKLTVAETEYELGAFHIGAHDRVAGAGLIEAALRDDPKLAPAHKEAGFLLFGKGEDAHAVQQFEQAFALDGTLYRSLFAKTMIAARLSPTDPATYRAELNKVVQINPKFAPAFIELAQLDLRELDFLSALANSHKAEALEPSRAGYHLLTGRILLAQNKDTDAAAYAKFVADRWYGPDHDEAVALWARIPAANRPHDVSLTVQPFGTEPLESAGGIIAATHCGDAKEPFTLVLTEAGKTRTFAHQHGFPSGFSDTLWYGEDHFTLCHHLEGQPAVVFFRPAPSGGSFAGELAELEIRDDFLPASAAPGAEPVPAPSKVAAQLH